MSLLNEIMTGQRRTWWTCALFSIIPAAGIGLLTWLIYFMWDLA